MNQEALRVYTTFPLNAGTVLEQLRQTVLTPNPIFFKRNHAEPPQIEAEQYQLSVGGLVGQPLSLSLEMLHDRFSIHTVTATLQCAGYRRRELTALEPIDESEIVWDADAIGTAEWTGFRLADVLEAVGIGENAAHVAFAGLDRIEKSGEVFGGSIPLEKALSSEVLLAFSMNGESLPPEHGYPLRLIVPGYIGARSVKWLASITLQAEPSQNYFQTRAYKLFPPEVRAEDADWEVGLMLGELPVNAFICTPYNGEHLADSRMTIQGFALASGDSIVQRVEVSCDGGHTWFTSSIINDRQQWAWCFWEVECHLAPGRYDLVVRAVDSAGRTQAEHLKEVWNFKGYLNNAYHRISIQVESNIR